MSKGQFATSKDAKAAGWFSRRHRTSETHMNAVIQYRNKANENKAPKQ